MAAANAIRKALIKMMSAKDDVRHMGGDHDLYPDDGINYGPMPTTGDELRETRRIAREVQPSDQLAEREAGRTLIGGRANTDAPDFDVGEAMVGTQGQLRHNPSRLPDQGGLDDDLVIVRPQDSLYSREPSVETRGHRMMRGGLHNPRDPNIEQGLLYPGEPGFEAQVARGGYGSGLSPDSPDYDAINKPAIEAGRQERMLYQQVRLYTDEVIQAIKEGGEINAGPLPKLLNRESPSFDPLARQEFDNIVRETRESMGSRGTLADDIDEIPF